MFAYTLDKEIIDMALYKSNKDIGKVMTANGWNYDNQSRTLNVEINVPASGKYEIAYGGISEQATNLYLNYWDKSSGQMIQRSILSPKITNSSKLNVDVVEAYLTKSGTPVSLTSNSAQYSISGFLSLIRIE